MLNKLAQRVHENNVNKGFWPSNKQDRNFGEALALCHSELSEALEPDAIKQDKNCPEFPNFIVEIGDCGIRTLDIIYGYRPGLDIEAEVMAAKDSGEIFISAFASFEEDINMVHRALSRALEAHRKYNKWEPELILAFSLLADISHKHNFCIVEVMSAKHTYNVTRPFKHGNKNY